MLLILPASRPLYLGLIFPSPLDVRLGRLSAISQGQALPDASSLDGKAMWYSLAAARIKARHPLSPQEVATVDGLMKAGAASEPENAFWPQARTALLVQLGRLSEAKECWLAAATCLRWNDHQNDFLASALAGYRHVPAYAFAELYAMRHAAGPKLCLDASTVVLADATTDVRSAAKLRLATILNGNLIRQYARSVEAMRVGTEMVESSVERPTDVNRPSNHTLAVARTKLITAIDKAGLGYDERALEGLFGDAEAANALTPPSTDIHSTIATESAEAALLYTLPGGLLFCSLIGLVILGLERLLRRFLASDGTQWVRIGVIAGVAVISGLFVTSVYAAFAAGLCVIFAGLTPVHVRKRRPDWIGPLFWVTTSAVGLVLELAGAVGLVVNSEQGHSLLAPLLPDALLGVSAPTGVTALALGFIFLCAPLWAFAQRLPTSHVLRLGLAQVGRKVVFGSLAFATISGPVCVYLDRVLVEHHLYQQFANEFLYYYLPATPASTPDHDADARP